MEKYTRDECGFTFDVPNCSIEVCREVRIARTDPPNSSWRQIDLKETYSRIGLLQSNGNLQSYLTTTKLWKSSVVLDYYEAVETYSRIGLVRS
jgi:hypothetical protein